MVRQSNQKHLIQMTKWEEIKARLSTKPMTVCDTNVMTHLCYFVSNSTSTKPKELGQMQVKAQNNEATRGMPIKSYFGSRLKLAVKDSISELHHFLQCYTNILSARECIAGKMLPNVFNILWKHFCYESAFLSQI